MSFFNESFMRPPDVQLPSSVVIAISTAGHPTTGAWATDQAVIDSNGVVWYCTDGGTPGTWVEGSAGGSVTITSPDSSVTVGGTSSAPTLEVEAAIQAGAAKGASAITDAAATPITADSTGMSNGQGFVYNATAGKMEPGSVGGTGVVVGSPVTAQGVAYDGSAWVSDSKPYDLWNSQASPSTVTDWGPIINAAITAGVRRFWLGEHDYPYSTELIICANGDKGSQSAVIFEGARGLGWYSGTSSDIWGTRLIWTGGASTQHTTADGAMTSGSTTLTSASAPWVLPQTSDNVYYNGYPITVAGAGPGGTNLVTTIASRNSNGSIVLATAASTTVSAATVTWTEFAVAINARGSTAFQMRDLKLGYNNTAFDGILLDLRSAGGAATWSARGNLERVDLSGMYNSGTTAQMAYALLHLNGHGEMFSARACNFGYAQSHVRGMYNMNADDAQFDHCNFTNNYGPAGSIVNPGRYWRFPGCRWNGSNGANPPYGPAFGSDGLVGSSLVSTIYLKDVAFWDYGTKNFTDGAMTSGSAVLTTTNADFSLAASYYINRTVIVAGAGAGGANLVAKILSVQSSTQVTLNVNAGTTVSAASWVMNDGCLFDQGVGSGYNWDLEVENMFSWQEPSPAFNLQGPGSLRIKKWVTNRPLRLDVLADSGPYIDLGPSTTAKKSPVILDDLEWGSPNLAANNLTSAILNMSGHVISRMHSIPFAPLIDPVGSFEHDSVLSLENDPPSIVEHSGQTLTAANCYGNDMVGQITLTTGSGGATAGALADITFQYAWPSLADHIPANDYGLYSIALTPLDRGDSTGATSAAAGAYAIVSNSNNTGWTLAIANAISGAKTVRWSYRTTRL